MIGNGVTLIGDKAFQKCASLTAITVDALNAAYSSVDGVLFDKSQTALIHYPGGKAGSYAVRSTVTAIGDEAFYSCRGLTGVTIPVSVTAIGDAAFYACTGLTGVTIPDSVTAIGEGAFYSCASLAGVLIDSDTASIGNGAFGDCNKKPEELTVSSTVCSVLTSGVASFLL